MSEPVQGRATQDGGTQRFRMASSGILALVGGVLTIVSNLLQ
ncbi:hypothetical protein [Haloactinospora alba]|nr:hypothetical protein [Haloactinospora alba]